MIDCGSDISIIKKNEIESTYNRNDTCFINGIGKGPVGTLGTTNSNIVIENCKITQKFHIVQDDFPILTNGILGRDFLASHKCNIDYDTWLLNIKIGYNIISIPIVRKNFVNNNVIPARCEILAKLNNSNIKEDCLVISEEICPGVFCANSIINAANSYIRIINTNNEDIVVPSCYRPNIKSLKEYYIYKLDEQMKTSNERLLKLKKELRITNEDPEVRDSLEQLCAEFNDIFTLKGDYLTENNFYKQNIELNDKKTTFIKNYRIPQTQKAEINMQIQNMLQEGIIQNSTSPFNSPILLVPKKSSSPESSKWRLVIDYRQLNKNITPDKFPLPRIDEILDQLGRAKYFSTLDLMSGFHQIGLEANSKKYTAFSSDTGHYEFNRLPFGLNISPNSFQRMMSIALSGLPPQCAFLYIDDIIVIGCSIKHHISNLRHVFLNLRKYNLKLNPTKCMFFKNEVTFLGHHVSKQGIQPDKTKYSAIVGYPVPTNADELRRFVAFCNYYRRFIRNFANIAVPLNKLLRKNVNFQWSEECQQSFEN